MSFAAEIAPVVDRLVLAVNTASRAESKTVIEEVCAEIGVDSAVYPGHYAEFLLAGRLTEQLAVTRLPYQPTERILASVTSWEPAGLAVSNGDRLEATAPLARLAEAILDARRVVATRLWSDRTQAVDTADALIALVLSELPTHYALAVEHAALPAPDDRFRRLHQRLTTLRYIRSQCHAEAWRARGLAFEDMMAMTALWHGGTSETLPTTLIEQGLATPTGLTDEGLEMRLAIEADTNRDNAPAFEPLDDDARRDLANALTSLPGTPL